MMKIFIAAAALAAAFADDSSSKTVAGDARVVLHKAAKCKAGKYDLKVGAPDNKCIQFPGERIWWSVDCSGDKGKDMFGLFSDKDCKKALTKAVAFHESTCIDLSSYGKDDSSSSSAYGAYAEEEGAVEHYDDSHKDDSHKVDRDEKVKVKYVKPEEHHNEKKDKKVEVRITAKCQLYETKRITELKFQERQEKKVRYETRKVHPKYASVSIKCPHKASDSSSSSSTAE